MRSARSSSSHSAWRAASACALTVLALLAAAVSASASDHVIAIDVSGSMRWNEAGQRISNKVPGPSRMEIVRPALTRYLGRLPEDSRVYLIAFNSGIVSQAEVVLSRPGDRERMLAWVNQLNPPADSETHLWATLRKALQQARVYAAASPGQSVSVRVITDGENDDSSSDLTLRKVLDEFPEVSAKNLTPDLVLLGSLKAEFVSPLEQAHADGVIHLIKLKKMADPFPPIIRAEPDPIVAGKPAVLLDDSKASFSSYEWSIDGQTLSRSNRVEHTFPSPGTAQVRVDVVRVDGSRDSARRTITIAPFPVVSAFVVPNEIVAGKAVTFINRSRGEVARHRWEVDGAAAGESEDLEHTFDKAGEHQVTLAVADSAANWARSAQTVQVAPAPPPAPPPVAKIKVVGSAFKTGEPIQLMDDSTGLIAQYQWKSSDDRASPDKNPVFTFDQPGRKEITLTVTGPGGVGSAAATIEVAPRYVAPAVTISAEPISGRLPLEVRFQATVSGDYDTLLWDFGDGTQMNGDAATAHTYGTAGSYQPQVRARHAISGLEGVSGGDLTVRVNNPPPWWRWWAALGALLAGIVGVGAWRYHTSNPLLEGRLEWEFEGRRDVVTLGGRRYPLSRIAVPGWQPAADYFIGHSDGTLAVCAKERTAKPLRRDEPVYIDGLTLTYRYF